MTEGISTIPSGGGIGNLGLATSSYSAPAPASAGAGGWFDKGLGYLGLGMDLWGKFNSVTGGNAPPPAPTYNVTVGGALSNQAPTTSSLAPFGNVGNALNYADEWLAQSKTLNQATTNVGTGVGSSLSSSISEYKNVLIIGVVAIVGFFIFKSMNKK